MCGMRCVWELGWEVRVGRDGCAPGGDECWTKAKLVGGGSALGATLPARSHCAGQPRQPARQPGAAAGCRGDSHRTARLAKPTVTPTAAPAARATATAARATAAPTAVAARATARLSGSTLKKSLHAAWPRAQSTDPKLTPKLYMRPTATLRSAPTPSLGRRYVRTAPRPQNGPLYSLEAPVPRILGPIDTCVDVSNRAPGP